MKMEWAAVENLCLFCRGLGGGAAAQPLVAWLQRGRREGPGRLPHGGRGLSAEAPLSEPAQKGCSPVRHQEGLPSCVSDDTLPRGEQNLCCTDSTRERFLWAAQKPVLFGT